MAHTPEHPTQTHQAGVTGPAKWRSTRFLLSYLACGGLCLMLIQRVSMSMAIVCMVNHTALREVHHNTEPGLLWTANSTTTISGVTRDSSSPTTTTTTTTTTTNSSDVSRQDSGDVSRCQSSQDDDDDWVISQDEEDGPLLWDRATQGQVLAVVYVGYMLSLIPGGCLVRRLGVRVAVGGCMGAMSVCHVLCHPAALLSSWAVVVLRFLSGIFSGVPFLGLYDLWRQWAPRTEQSQLIGITFAGITLAGAVSFPITALLCRYGFWGGWPSAFYVLGGAGVVWSITWLVLVTDSPETHPRISSAERRYIVTTRADASDHTDKVSVPWRSILRSPCVWVIALAHFVYYWGFTLLLTNLPTFFHDVLHFHIQSNGVFSMLPYLALFLVTSGTGFIFDAMIRRRLLSKLTVRKLSVTVATVVPGLLLVALSHLRCRQTVLMVALLVTAVALTGINMTGGFFVNPYDIAPRHALHILTVTSTCAVSAGFLNSYLVAAVTADASREQWQVVFYVTGGLFLLSATVFCVLAKAHVQPWARPADHTACENPIYSKDTDHPVFPQDSDSPVFHQDPANPIYSQDSEHAVYPKDSENPVFHRDPGNPIYSQNSENPVYRQDSDSPVFPKDSENSVFPEDSDNPVFPQDSDNLVFPKDSKNSVFPEDSENPVFPQDSENLVYLQDSDSPVFPKDSENSVFPQDSDSPVFPKDSENPVFPQDSDSPVYPTDFTYTSDTANAVHPNESPDPVDTADTTDPVNTSMHH